MEDGKEILEMICLEITQRGAKFLSLPPREV